MNKWYWRFDVSNTDKREWWAIGKMGERVRWPDGVSDDWLMKYGFKTRAAAVRSAGGVDLLRKREWRNRILIDHRDIACPDYHYKVYKCYEIVIEDAEGNQIGDCNYCYGTKPEAYQMAEHELKLATMGKGE